MAGIYVHIPFCVSRCVYCAFCSTTRLSLRERYVAALARELELRGGYLHGEKIETIYVGGGTPSVLGVGLLRRLLDMLPTAEAQEITVECNPDDVSSELVARLRDSGVNRVSLGVQTYDDARLRFLRRRHTAAQARDAVALLRSGGIDNISIDLMFGFPEQSLDAWHADLREALSLAVEHLSAYCLTYEEGTPLFDMLERGAVAEADEETCRAMYYSLVDTLSAAGYEHYEISNFCRPGYRSLHNSNYWRDVAYLGLGAAAHSFDHASRQWNIEDVEGYICAIERGVLPFERELLTADEHYNDLVTTALRTKEGLDLDSLAMYSDYLLSSAQPFIVRGLLATDGHRLWLTREALFISDSILAELMKV